MSFKRQKTNEHEGSAKGIVLHLSRNQTTGQNDFWGGIFSMSYPYKSPEEYKAKPRLEKWLGHKLQNGDDWRDPVTGIEYEIKGINRPSAYFANGWMRIDSVSLNRHVELHGDKSKLVLVLTDKMLIASIPEVVKNSTLEEGQAFRQVRSYNVPLKLFREVKTNEST